MDQVIQRKRLSPRLCLVLALCLFVVAMALRQSFGTGAKLHSPPDRIRMHAREYARTIKPLPAILAHTNVQLPAFQITSSNFAQHISHPYEQSRMADILGPVVVHHVKASERVEAGGVSLQLQRIGYGGAPAPGKGTGGFFQGGRAGQFFTPDLKPLPEEALRKALPGVSNQLLPGVGLRPSFRFDLTISGESWKCMSAKLYDARTQVMLSLAHGELAANGEYRVTAHPAMWHAGPVKLVIDLAVGPVEHEEIMPKAGATFSVANVPGQIVYAGNNQIGETPRYDFDKDRVRLRFRTFPSNGQAVFLWYVSHYTDQTAFDIEYIDATGRTLERNPVMNGGQWIMHDVTGNLDQISKVRIRKYRHQQRFIIDLPALPGLPKENQQVTDLFQVRVPYLYFATESEQYGFIASTTQLKFDLRVAANPPPNSYPRALTNASVAEVLLDYARANSLSADFYVDPVGDAIEQPEHSLEAVGRRVKRKLGIP
ncbi:MAG: hypothetical protein ACO1QS_07660 [Verrucomicrobiota bacterium]